MSTPTNAEAEAKEYLKKPELLQKYVLPATADHPALEIAYSDLGRQPVPDKDAKQLPAILFMPGLLASRLQSTEMDFMAVKFGVRILTVDRFGIGQSSNVPIESRMSIWLELVPKLLAHLEITSVSLLSHSAGTLYLFNTLYACRHLLSPTKPYAALLGPWVDVKQSGIKSLQAAQLLPNIALGQFGNLIKFLNTYIGPPIDSSLTFVDKLLSKNTEPSAKIVERRRYWQAEYGVAPGFASALLNASVQAVLSESTTGLGDDVQLLLKKGGSWGVCENYKEYFEKMAIQETSRDKPPQLQVKVFFAEEDDMIGPRGQQYLESCWKHVCDGEHADAFNMELKTITGTDHNGLLGEAVVLEEIMRDVVQAA